jgi:uncharacterized membrane protein YfcA
MEWWLAYLGIGIAVGFLAGLLGIGGGAITVPLLVWALGAQALPAEHVMRLALGTSMAVIFFTSLSSMRAHQQRGAVDWNIVRAMAPGILAGSFGAALAAAYIPTRGLAVIFTVLAFYAAVQMLFELRPAPSRTLPGAAGLFAAGAGIGVASSLFAAGGAFLTVPFLVWCNVPIRRAIGTAAGNGFPIALAGTAGYVLQGLRAEGLPPATIGYVYLPALVLIVVASMSLAPIGARTAYRMPVKALRIVFAILIGAMALRTLATLW